MDDWVKEWVSERRKNGEKGIEIKSRGKSITFIVPQPTGIRI